MSATLPRRSCHSYLCQDHQTPAAALCFGPTQRTRIPAHHTITKRRSGQNPTPMSTFFKSYCMSDHREADAAVVVDVQSIQHGVHVGVVRGQLQHLQTVPEFVARDATVLVGVESCEDLLQRAAFLLRAEKLGRRVGHRCSLCRQRQQSLTSKVEIFKFRYSKKIIRFWK